MITVCVPTYDRYQDLENLIKSFLAQKYKNSQLLILDDLGSSKISDVVKKWQKTSNKIIYHKNKKNLGFSNNFLQSFKLIKSEIVVFMGDDDVFVDDHALEYFANVFKDKRIGIAKAAQLLYKEGKVNQAFKIKNISKEFTVYRKGMPTYRHVWFESLSITGLAFRITKEIHEFLPKASTLYPQVDIMGKMALLYDTATINKYLVGVQSHKGQLNPIIFKLDNKSTTILDDWITIYQDVQEASRDFKTKTFTEQEFREKLTKFTTVFFPYTTLKNGRGALFHVAKLSMFYNKNIIFYPFFITSFFISFFLPNFLISWIIEIEKNRKLNMLVNKKDLDKYNMILSQYYTL